MFRGVLSGTLLAVVVSCPQLVRAQNADIWKQGAWAVPAPQAGSCGTLPLLQVKGPGSIFDPPNASILAGLEKTLPGALATVCPGTREVILVSGRTRRLIRLAGTSVSATAAAPAAAQLPAVTPSAATPPVVQQAPPRETIPAPAVATARAEIVPTPAAPPPQQQRTPAPVLASRRDLKNVSSARNIEDKCEVLLNWLESSKSESAPAANYRGRPGADVLAIFRDEPMTEVFGMPYDKTENRWRLEQHEKVISRCLGLAAPRPNPLNIRQRPNVTLQQYGQQFQQYRQVLDQSFLGQPGAYEPTAISRYVQQVRTQTAWANQAMASGAAATPVRESFERLTEQRQAANGQMSLLSAAEKSQVADYLSRRQAEIAPAIVDDWFREASASQKTVASAKVLNNSHAAIANIVNALDPAARAASEDRYKRLMESLIAEPIQAEIARLNALPASLAGVQQLAVWKAGFDTTFRDLRALPAVEAAGYEYSQTRTRIFTGALPSWQQQVQAIPAEGVAITAKRRELETLFPVREDRSSPVFAQYESPLRAKEEQLRARVEADRRKQQELASAAAQPQQSPGRTQTATTAARPSAPLTESSFSASGLSNEKLITSLFLGDFVNINIERDQLGFSALYSSYLNAYARRCSANLPPNKVEMTRQECATERVTKNGFGTEISRYCVEYVTVGTGLFADPDMYAAKLKLEAIQAGDAFRTLGRMMSQSDPLGGAFSMLADAQASKSDMDAVVQMNACTSPGLKRFEENLKLFALNKQPIRLGASGPTSSAVDPLPGIPFRDQNYTKLIEDLVSEQSKTWVMNRFDRGSVQGVSVSSRDQAGRPAKIGARYVFNGRSQGTVSLTFTEGLPECLYFFDFPATCRTANRRIVAAYADGAYQQ